MTMDEAKIKSEMKAAVIAVSNFHLEEITDPELQALLDRLVCAAFESVKLYLKSGHE